MNFLCPLCGTELVTSYGNQIHPGDKKYGVLLHCPGLHPAVCPAQEVAGHGDTAKEAFEVIMHKYKGGRNRE